MQGPHRPVIVPLSMLVAVDVTLEKTPIAALEILCSPEEADTLLQLLNGKQPTFFVRSIRSERSELSERIKLDTLYTTCPNCKEREKT